VEQEKVVLPLPLLMPPPPPYRSDVEVPQGFTESDRFDHQGRQAVPPAFRVRVLAHLRSSTTRLDDEWVGATLEEGCAVFLFVLVAAKGREGAPRRRGGVN
jgi:hypothetical protein